MIELTPDDLKAALIRLFGRRGWQMTAAERLGVDVATVRRWTSGAVPVPGPVRAAVACWLRERGAKESCTRTGT
ncbi:MAG: hypothetical protein R3D28_04525 [Geminicoccaceae bacterium]